MPWDRSTTERSHQTLRWALVGWFSDPANHDKPNREAARVLRIDEGTVRNYRKSIGLPPSESTSAGKPREPTRRAKKKPSKLQG